MNQTDETDQTDRPSVFSLNPFSLNTCPTDAYLPE